MTEPEPEDQAYLEGQKTGKSVLLCGPQNSFQTLYAGCQLCVSDAGISQETVKTYLDPKFSLFIDFCKSINQTTSHTTSYTVTTPPEWLTVEPTTATTVYTVVALDGKTQVTTVTLITNATKTRPDSPARSSITPSLNNTGSTPTSKASSLDSGSGNSVSSTGIIAGSVVGGCVLIAVFGLMFFYLWWRRRGLRLEAGASPPWPTADKPQLHSDCIPKPEVFEMDGGDEPQVKELDAEQDPRGELQGDEAAVEAAEATAEHELTESREEHESAGRERRVSAKGRR